MKKILSLALALCVLISICTAAMAEETVTLRFSWWGGDARLAATLAVINQFEELHPNITIEPEYGSSDGYNDKLAAGTEPDIMQIEPGNMALLVSDETNYFVDLLQTDFDLSGFNEAYISQRINGRYDGKQVGLPTGLAGIALVVNKDLADAIGIDFTQDYTWEDMIEWGKKVREYDDSMYLLCSNKDYMANIIARTYAKHISGTQVISDETHEVTSVPITLPSKIGLRYMSSLRASIRTKSSLLLPTWLLTPVTICSPIRTGSMANMSAASPGCPPPRSWLRQIPMFPTRLASSL